MNQRGRHLVGCNGDGLDAGEPFLRDGLQARRIRMHIIADEHGADTHDGKHVGQEHFLPEGPPLIDHGLQGGVVNGNVGRIGGVVEAGQICAVKRRDLGKGKGITVGIKQRLQIQPPGAVADAVIGDPILGHGLGAGTHMQLHRKCAGCR
jgi:hypothetical protein